MAIAVRTTTEADDAAFERARGLAYGGSVAAASPEPLAAAVREHDRGLVAIDGDEVVATSLGYSFDMSVPGDGSHLATAGFAGVSVVPTHRRQGILRRLMRHNLDSAHERGEPLSVLWPSESPIYRRFGYGAATAAVSWELPRHRTELIAGLTVEPRRVRILPPDPSKVVEAIAPVHDEVRRRRPGMLGRNPGWWHRRTANATSSHVWVVADGPDGTEGYASYSVRSSWQADGPANVLQVGELAATTTAAEVALWQYLFGVDLVRTITAWGRPPDDALPHLLADSRRMQRRVAEGAWVRLVDVATALAGRRYRAGVDLVIEVKDDFCPWNEGRWRVQAGPSVPAECSASTEPADVTLDVADLAAAYLGGTSLWALAQAGLVVEHTPGAVEEADRAFSWAPAPWGVTWF